MTRTAALPTLLLYAFSVLPSCSEEPRGGAVETVRTAARDVDLAATDLHRFGYKEPAPPFLFALPAGWTEVDPAPLRELNIVVPGAAGKETGAECYVSILQGGGTLDNINRWRRQMSAAPISDAEIDALPVHDVFGRRSVLVDVEGTYQGMGAGPREGMRLLGFYAAFPAFGVSVKMIGDAATVGAQRDAFVAFAESLELNPERFGRMPAAGAESPHGGAPPSETPAATSGSSKLQWIVPDHWAVGDGPAMREVTLDVKGKDDAQCWVTILGGRAGGVLANLNRWRREVGSDPMSAADMDNLPQLKILGNPSVLLEVEGSYQGMSGPKIDEALLYGVVCDLGDSLLFVKMVGRTADLKDERSHFIAFCESLSR